MPRRSGKRSVLLKRLVFEFTQTIPSVLLNLTSWAQQPQALPLSEVAGAGVCAITDESRSPIPEEGGDRVA